MNHRVGGLEDDAVQNMASLRVNHRVGGLEGCQHLQMISNSVNQGIDFQKDAVPSYKNDICDSQTSISGRLLIILKDMNRKIMYT